MSKYKVKVLYKNKVEPTKVITDETSTDELNKTVANLMSKITDESSELVGLYVSRES